MFLAEGCGALPDSEDGSFSGQAVVGGSNVSVAQNNSSAFPYGATVQIAAPQFGQSANFPSVGGQPTSCSGIKIGANRYLTAAHCVDTWSGPFQGQVLISNHPSNQPGALDSYTVTAVYVHPSWAMKSGEGNWLGRPYDVAMFDVQETNAIPALASNGSPKINTADITNGWFSRLVGYGSGVKAWGDNSAVSATGDHPFYDEAAMAYTSFFWTGNPSGEPGDSGSPVLNEFSTGWWVSGVMSGPGASSTQSRIGRVEPVINWIKNPTQPAIAGGSAGYLINRKAPACLQASGTGFASQWACYAATSSTDVQYWVMQSTGVSGRFRLKNGKTGLCIAVVDSSNGGHIVQQACDTANSNAFQKWDFVAKGNLDTSDGDTAVGFKFYQLKNAGSARCIGPNNGSALQGQLFHQYTCTTANDFLWAFTR